MSCGSLPPVPDLIPISAFQINNITSSGAGKRKQQQHQQGGFNNNHSDEQECAPCSVHGEVMGEQRSRQTGKQPAIDLIDTSRSRGLSAAPQAPFRKTRPERHRKSERRREHRRARKRSASKQSARRSRTPSPERPVNPRVNPIFVWVRQEDTHIVDVKCEDYDKRNRILLTKTAQGWRAIPRTETLVPSLKEADDKTPTKSHHRLRKQRKTHKVKRRSMGVQVDEEISEPEMCDRPVSPPSWDDPVNVESHLPSHTIRIPKSKSETLNETAARRHDVNKRTCDVSPLDNLLAVAELEFNHQLQSGEWDKCTEDDNKQKQADDSEYINNIDQLNKFIDSCSNTESENNLLENFGNLQQKSNDCDYNDDDDNNLAMDDILNRLEQSLRSPEMNSQVDQGDDILQCEDLNELHQEHENFVFESKDSFEEPVPPPDPTPEMKPEESKPDNDEIVEIPDDDVPTDLSTKPIENVDTNDDQPTDLSLPKRNNKSPPPRPSSHGSETIQSPQPSGIPAVPPSPDIFVQSNQKSKSIFLDSLLAHTTPKPVETTAPEREKEPLDLGNFRKSASPTVTCSEEVKNNVKPTESEPPAKKMKVEDITLKRLLDVQSDIKTSTENSKIKETSRLLELLTAPVEPDPVAQLAQVLSDNSISIPDPLLVPKNRLSQILASPAREIPRLLIDRPELRLPQALAFPHLLQDPDILVITIQQLQTIIQKQSQVIPLKETPKPSEEKLSRPAEVKSPKVDAPKAPTPKPQEASNNKEDKPKEPPKKHNSTSNNNNNNNNNETGNDIDAAASAFNQMMWLPYLNQLENNNPTSNHNNDFLKLLAMSYQQTHQPDMTHLLNMNRFMPPNAFPMQPPFPNPMEYSNWQEAMMQANMLRPKNPYEAFNKNFYREMMEKNATAANKKQQQQQQQHQQQSHYPQKQTGKSNYGHNNMFAPNMPNIPQFQNPNNPLLNMPFPSNGRSNLQVPQFNPIVPHQRANGSNRSRHYGNKSTPRIDHFGVTVNEKKSSQNGRSQEQQSNGRLHNKQYGNLNGHEGTGNRVDGLKHHHSGMQPIDLSGSTASGSKLKVRQHLIDPGHAARLLKQDDVPEVGSTTASIEEMQDAQKYLWHPLFGNQKNYTSPWNWTTVTATGE